jgi:hypothetical protein
MFKSLTLIFSKETASLATVIPAMDRADEKLTTAIASPKYSSALKAALSLGKKLLNKYYSLTDASDVYRIAIGEYFDHLLSCSCRLYTIL